jgi:hypothetical protein
VSTAVAREAVASSHLEELEKVAARLNGLF